ncbi:hypothetical protein L6164_014537 [Bauhinia variegata]|uniref:Uncharacterized protein n=1 Tax=Bauhinia variegata TaxID=167791 RepID=A0ACB9NIU8_BAUVA|nr:hypothetical protein L6164_014537 [Bauhinia variegata]
MAEERPQDINIMSVELAIRRELAYRKKVSMMQLQSDDSAEHLIPSESSSSALSSGPHASPSLLGIKRQAPSSNFEFLPVQQQEPRFDSHVYKKKRDNLFCAVCQTACSSVISYKQHLKGRRHNAQLHELKSGRKDIAEVAQVGSQRQKCQICDVWCMNVDSLKQHLAGQKHKFRLEKLRLNMKGGRATAKKRRFCYLCKIWCHDEYSLQMHLKGKQHLDQLNAAKQRKRGKGEKVHNIFSTNIS